MIILDFIFLSLYTQELSISYREAKIYFSELSGVSLLAHFGSDIFGENDLGIRFFFIFFHILNSILIYKISKRIVKQRQDRFLVLIIYLLLPGVNSSALILSKSEIILFMLLLFVYLYQKKSFLLYFVLLATFFIDKSFIILYVALLFVREKSIKYFALILLVSSLSLIDFEVFGRPKSYFLDTFGIYMAIFSPLLFLFFIYTIYRVFIKEQKEITFYISSTALILSLVLSFRQKIYVIDFAPFLVVAVPLMIKVFFMSYRVRLYEFRAIYRYIFIVVISTLVFNFIVTFFNKPLYLFTNRHFANKFHIAKELANELKERDLKELNIEDKKMQLRLKFYGISQNSQAPKLSKELGGEEIVIKYLNIEADKFYVSR